MFLAAPLLGHGAQSFGPGHWAYLPAWAPRFPEGHVLWAHNLYLDLLAEQGIFGATAFIILFAQPLCRAMRVARHANAPSQRALGWTALSAFAGLFVAAGLELSLIRRYVPLTLFALLGFAMKLGAPEPGEPQRD
jgi:O-antigen ligase